MADQTVNLIVDWVWYVIESLISAFCRNFFPSSAQHRESLRGKRALVTGGGGGIGRLIALNLAKQGCNLVLWDVFEAPNAATAQLCKEIGVDVRHEVVDITDRHKVYEHAKSIFADLGTVDILVNNAGVISDSKAGFLKCDDEKVETLMKVNSIAHFWTVKAFLPAMMDQKRGHILSIASVAGITGTPGLVDYCASKFAAVGFMEAIENEVHCQGFNDIRFTTVCPTFVNTPMIDNVNTFNQKLLTPEVVAEAAVDAVQLHKHVVFLPAKVNWLYAVKGLIPWNLWRSIVFKRKFQYT